MDPKFTFIFIPFKQLLIYLLFERFEKIRNVEEFNFTSPKKHPQKKHSEEKRLRSICRKLDNRSRKRT